MTQFNKGPRKVLLLACLRDDTDGEMAGLVELLRKKKTGKHSVVVREMDQYFTSSKENAIPKAFNELAFVGHAGPQLTFVLQLFTCVVAEFFNLNSPLPSGGFAVHSMSKRTIGGYRLASVLEVVRNAVFERQVTVIKFYCCESATSVHSEKLAAAHVRFSGAHARYVAAHLGAGNSGAVSTIAIVAAFVWFLASGTKFASRTVRIQGLNGYGYYTTEDARSRTFDSRHYSELLAIQKKEHELRAKVRSGATATDIKELSQTIAEDVNRFVALRIDGKQSAHKVQLTVCPDKRLPLPNCLVQLQRSMIDDLEGTPATSAVAGRGSKASKHKNKARNANAAKRQA